MYHEKKNVENRGCYTLYGRKCRTPICWEEVGERKLLGPEIVQLTTNKVRVIKKTMKEAQDR